MMIKTGNRNYFDNTQYEQKLDLLLKNINLYFLITFLIQ